MSSFQQLKNSHSHQHGRNEYDTFAATTSEQDQRRTGAYASHAPADPEDETAKDEPLVDNTRSRKTD
jgi:hypothetical protein